MKGMRRALQRASVIVSGSLLLSGCGVFEHFYSEANSGSVALGVDGEHLEIFIGVCEVKPEVVHLTNIWGPSEDREVAAWETGWLGLGEGVHRVSGKESDMNQVLGEERIRTPVRSVSVWVEPKGRDDLIPFTEATPDQLKALGEDEVLTAKNGESLVMTEAEYESNHCLGPSD